jgi:hypothetical protein
VALQVTAHQLTLRRIMVRQAMVDPAALQATAATVVDLAVRRTTVEGRTMAEAVAATAQLLIARQAMGAAIPLAEAAEATPAAEVEAIPVAEANPAEVIQVEVTTRSSSV